MAEDLAVACSSSLVGVYVHGSAVLGDFLPGISDLDLLVVVVDDCSEKAIEAISAVLFDDRSLLATGVEASAVARAAARSPAAPWPFRVHVTTGAADRKRVSGRGHPGDTDLILHYLVTREKGWPAFGPRPSDVIGEVPRDHVLRQLADELRWAAEEASDSYAILNTCRALRYFEEGVICSKTQGGDWALERGIQPDLVRRALAHRGEGTQQHPRADSKHWIVSVAASIAPE